MNYLSTIKHLNTLYKSRILLFRNNSNTSNAHYPFATSNAYMDTKYSLVAFQKNAFGKFDGLYFDVFGKCFIGCKLAFIN